MRSGRSPLLSLALSAPHRPRAWGRRWLGVAAALVAVATPVWIVATRALPLDGPARPLYALHDMVFVPFWSLVWVRAGVWSLLWFVPILVLTALAMAEFLGIGQPLRRLQIGTLRMAMRGPAGRFALWLQQSLGWRKNREGLLVAVLEADLTTAEIRCRTVIETGQGVAPAAALGRLALQLTYLRAADPAHQLRGAEALALIERLDGSEAARQWQTRFARIWPDEVAAQIEQGLSPLPEELPALLAGLRGGTLDVSRLALASIALSRPQALVRPDLVTAWFTEWAQLRHLQDPPPVTKAGPVLTRPITRQLDLAEAERLIDFGFWSALAEKGLAGQRRRQTREDEAWLSALLPGVALRRAMGELAAVGRAGEA